MALPWVRLETSFPQNPKVLALVADKRWQDIVTYVSGLAYSGAQGTDGFIPRAALASIHGTPRVATSLVSAGLWQKDRAGWYMPDWDEFQQTSSQVADYKAKKQAASRKGNCARWHPPGCECWREAS